jgi:hypothetical protein
MTNVAYRSMRTRSQCSSKEEDFTWMLSTKNGLDNMLSTPKYDERDLRVVSIRHHNRKARP